MSGNVWKWSYSLYQLYPYQTDDGREDRFATGYRTLRGGAWRNPRCNARVSAHFRNRPENFLDFIGMRLVVAPVFLSSGA